MYAHIATSFNGEVRKEKFVIYVGDLNWEDSQSEFNSVRYDTRQEAYDAALAAGLTPCPTCCYREPKY